MSGVYKEINTFKNDVMKEVAKLKFSSHQNNNNDQPNKSSYAKVAAGEVVIIKPRVAQENIITRNVIKEHINPSEVQVGISEIKNLNEGGVLIKCQTKSEVDKITTIAKEKLSEHYQIESQKMKNPCIKIIDIDKELSATELIEHINNLNKYLVHDKQKLKIVAFKKMVKKYMAIVECDPITFSKLPDDGRIFINWSRCRFFEHVHLFRCYTCGGFNHGSKDCSEKDLIKCIKCCEVGHKKENCPNDVIKCVNCVELNKKAGTNLDVNHSCFDLNCTILQKKTLNGKEKICYNTDNL